MALSFSKAVKVASYNVVILIGLLVGMEALLRWLQIPYSSEYTPTENAIARFDPQLGWSYRPELSTTVRFGENTVKVCFDSRGIRVPEPDFNFDYNRPSILFIGGSFTMGHGLPYEETFPGVLSGKARFPLQVVNLGVQAYGTDQSYLALQRHISSFKTKFVVYTFINNHIFRNGNYDRRTLYPNAHFLGTKPLFGLNERNELVLEKRPLLYKDYHHSWMWDAGKLLMRQKFGFYAPYPVALTHALIKEIKQLCEDNGAKLIVLHWRISPHEPKDTLHGSGAVIVDLLDSIPGLNNLKIPGDAHPNAKAHEAVARVLLQALKATD